MPQRLVVRDVENEKTDSRTVIEMHTGPLAQLIAEGIVGAGFDGVAVDSVNVEVHRRCAAYRTASRKRSERG